MSEFIQSTVNDLRTGRETWRVFAAASAIALTAAIGLQLVIA